MFRCSTFTLEKHRFINRAAIEHLLNNINLYDENNNLLYDQKKIANKLNDYFVNIGSTTGNNIPDTSGSYRDYLKNINCRKSFYASPTGPLEVDKNQRFLRYKQIPWP